MDSALLYSMVWLHQSNPFSFTQASSSTPNRLNRALELRVPADSLIKIFGSFDYALFD
jgi:hypothetical protein